MSFEVIALKRNPEFVNNNTTILPVTIRPAYATDNRALCRLAQLDSRVLPPEPLLVAEVDGELRVAVSMTDGAVVADPFAPTAQLVQVVRDHIARTAEPSPGRRLRFRPGLPAALRAG